MTSELVGWILWVKGFDVTFGLGVADLDSMTAESLFRISTVRPIAPKPSKKQASNEGNE